MTQKSPTDTESSSGTPAEAEATESSETVPEMFTRLTANNPQFVPAKPSGKAFVIPAARPSTKR